MDPPLELRISKLLLYRIQELNTVVSSTRCETEDILLEMDRILRPEGTIVFRDDVDILVKTKSIADRMRWQSQIVDHENGPHVREKLLLVVKTYWTAEDQNQHQ
jgi:Putative S-adenosyl-L-methionine-dependent methyltransferase